MNPANDLKLLYASWPATAVVWIPALGQGNTGRAIHNLPGTSLQGNEVFLTGHTLQYPANTFPSVRQGDRFVVEGDTYTVTEPPLTTQDGLEFIAALSRTT